MQCCEETARFASGRLVKVLDRRASDWFCKSQPQLALAAHWGARGHGYSEERAAAAEMLLRDVPAA